MTIVVLVASLASVGAGLASVAAWRSRRRTERAARATPPTAPELEAAREEAGRIVAQAREAALASRQAAFDELGARRAALDAIEQRLRERSAWLDSRRRAAEDRRRQLEERRTAVAALRADVAARERAVEERRYAVAGLDREMAVAIVLDRCDQELEADHGARVERAVAARVGDVMPTVVSLIAEAVQRQDASHIDATPRPGPVSLDGLEEAERERLLSALAVVGDGTDTDLGIDHDRNLATLRGLDPVGREVARQASLEILDRRLSSEQVPPVLVRMRRELQREILARGERVLWEMDVEGRPELAELLGILHYRFSYGQNALLHCRETGHLCAVLASELRMDAVRARAAGLLHDIGKAVDHDVEGAHAIIGGEILAVLGHDPEIVHAVKAHHFDEEPATDLAMLTICADALSASRPGARRDTLTTYLQRLEHLQRIATRHRGVERAFPLQAGREVRVSVRPEVVSDADVPELCRAIARQIEAEMAYPGIIKVTVVRETAASATAS